MAKLSVNIFNLVRVSNNSQYFKGKEFNFKDYKSLSAASNDMLQTVYVLRSVQLTVRMKKNNHVNVRKATLLKFNGPNMCHCLSHKAMFKDVISWTLRQNT